MRALIALQTLQTFFAALNVCAKGWGSPTRAAAVEGVDEHWRSLGMAGEASGGRPVDGQRRDAAPGDPRTRPYAATLKPRGPYPFSGPAATATRTNSAVLVRYAPLSKKLLKISAHLAMEPPNFNCLLHFLSSQM